MKTKKLLSMLLTLVMVLSLGSVNVFAEGGEGNTTATCDLSNAALTKDLKVADGIDINSFNSFDFSFTAKGSSTAPAAEHPGIENQTVTVGTQSGDHAYGSLTLDNVFSINDFSHAGEYVYTVKEIAGSNSNMTYDTNSYTLHLYVTNGTDGLEFSGVTVQKGEDKVDPTIKEGEQISGFNFENTYKENLSDDDDNNAVLTVTKKVTGAYGDKTKTFPITVTLTIPSTAVESDVVLDDNSKGTLSNLTVTANLADSDSIIFKQLPAGTTFKVSETQAVAYKSKVTGYVAAEDTDYVEGIRTDIAGQTITETGKTVTIENNREDVIPTGIIISNLPYILLVMIAGVGVTFIVLKKKRANV